MPKPDGTKLLKAKKSETELVSILSKRILVLDGAMGTMIQRHNLTESDYRGQRFKDFTTDLKGNNDLLSLTQPKIISEIHDEYLSVGSDIIETNTFSATSVGMSDYFMQDLVYELNFESAKLAKQSALKYTEKTPDKPRFVAGSIGPTNRTLSMSPDVNSPSFRTITFTELANAYKEQIVGLMDGGVDILLIETVFDTLNAKAALFACEDVFVEKNLRLPIMVSGTITDASGRTLSGQTPEAFAISVTHVPLLSIGLNCALGAKDMLPHLQSISKTMKGSEVFISAHPNAGLPNAFGQYDETPETMLEQVKIYMESGLINIVGGCCGTTPDHIKLIADAALNYQPRLLD